MQNDAITALNASWVAPVVPRQQLWADFSVVMHQDRIIDLISTNDLAEKYPHADCVDLSGHLLIPGLINLHTHAAMSLMRGRADDLPLQDWLQKNIWPLENQVMSAEFVKDGTLLACAEMLRGGVTCFNDMYFFPESAAKAAIEVHMRASLGILAIETHSAYGMDALDYLNKGLATRDALRDESLISFCLAPHAPYSVSNQTLERIALYAAELDLPVHIHLHEAIDEIEQSLQQYQVRPLKRLQHLGLVDPHLVAVHAVHLNTEEIELLSEHGAHVAHCPTSNLKLANGLCDVGALLKAGVNVGLGSDGAASNNRLDILAEMRLGALLAKFKQNDAGVINVHQALEMATLNGAKALGLDQKIGSLEIGKKADIVALNLNTLELSPCYHPLSHLTYSAGRENVNHVWVDGVQVLQHGQLLHIDQDALIKSTQHWFEIIKRDSAC
jgi:5-methylthioadenosine/S-adenosylhomocysteine deaminase